MDLGHQGLMQDITASNTKQFEFPPHVASKPFDLESICTLALIRQHTKTDDVPSVTNDQLELYRQAAFEAAEQYTGMLFSEQRRVEEVVSKRSGRRPYITHRLKYPTADGYVYAYGSNNGIPDQTIRVTPGDRKITLSWVPNSLDLSSCCAGPCDNQSGPMPPSINLLYVAGISQNVKVPAGIIAGVLRYIAFSVMNAGDEILTVRNRQAKGDVGIIGSNNVALSSGALELWRQYDNEGF